MQQEINAAQQSATLKSRNNDFVFRSREDFEEFKELFANYNGHTIKVTKDNEDEIYKILNKFYLINQKGQNYVTHESKQIYALTQHLLMVKNRSLVGSPFKGVRVQGDKFVTITPGRVSDRYQAHSSTEKYTLDIETAKEEIKKQYLESGIQPVLEVHFFLLNFAEKFENATVQRLLKESALCSIAPTDYFKYSYIPSDYPGRESFSYVKESKQVIQANPNCFGFKAKALEQSVLRRTLKMLINQKAELQFPHFTEDQLEALYAVKARYRVEDRKKPAYLANIHFKVDSFAERLSKKNIELTWIMNILLDSAETVEAWGYSEKAYGVYVEELRLLHQLANSWLVNYSWNAFVENYSKDISVDDLAETLEHWYMIQEGFEA